MPLDKKYHYSVTQGKGQEYIVCKWNEFDDIPENEYVVFYHKRTDKYDCDCLGFRRYPEQTHKHILLVKQWIEDGEPMLNNYRLDEFNNPHRQNGGP